MKHDFNGSRLKEARIFSKFTIKELSEKLEVSKQQISKYENANVQPRPTVLLKLVSTLNFPIAFYHEQSNFSSKAGETFFRANLTSSKKEKKSQELNSFFLAVVRDFFEKRLNFIQLESIDNRESISFYSTEEAAMYLREKWNLGNAPIENMVRLLEEKGFVVSSLNVDSKNVDAFGRSVKINDQSYYVIALENDKGSFFRRQFSAAHELAHWLLHDSIEVLDDQTHQEFKEMERQANDFASAFLLPRDSFGKDVSVHPNKLEYYIELKKKWKVSIAAMVRRAFTLEIINVNQYEYLVRKMGYLGWRKREPLDETTAVKEPEAFPEAYDLLVQHDYFSKKSFTEMFTDEMGVTLNPRMLEVLIGLEEGTLQIEKTNTDNLSIFPTSQVTTTVRKT